MIPSGGKTFTQKTRLSRLARDFAESPCVSLTYTLQVLGCASVQCEARGSALLSCYPAWLPGAAGPLQDPDSTLHDAPPRPPQCFPLLFTGAELSSAGEMFWLQAFLGEAGIRPGDSTARVNAQP